MSKYRTIVPHKVVGQEIEEAALAAETLPGTLVTIAKQADDTFVATKLAVRGQKGFVVYENELGGKLKTDAIAADDRVQCYHIQPGIRFTGIVKDNVAIALGDILVGDVNGVLDKAADAVAAVEDGASGVTTTWPKPAEAVAFPQTFVAEEACAANATGDNRRILVRAL